MATIELYSSESEAMGARDHYNHNLNRRAVISNVPNDPIVDFGGGPAERVFQNNINPSLWMLVVED